MGEGSARQGSARPRPRAHRRLLRRRPRGPERTGRSDAPFRGGCRHARQTYRRIQAGRRGLRRVRKAAAPVLRQGFGGVSSSRPSKPSPARSCPPTPSNPCARDASACPKPPPAPPPPPPKATPAPPPEPPLGIAKGGVCVPASASPRQLAVHDRPYTTAPAIVRLARGQCGIVQTHLHALPVHPGGTAWEEITVDGKTGWIRLGLLPGLARRVPEFAVDDWFPFKEPRYRRPYRRYPERPYYHAP